MAEPSDPISLTPIGVVRNAEHDPARQDWSRVRSRIELQPDLATALDGLEGFSHVIVVGWLDRIPRSCASGGRRTPAATSGYRCSAHWRCAGARARTRSP